MTFNTDIRRSASVVVLILILALLALGVVLLTSSFVPYEDVKARIDSMAQDGSAEGFTEVTFAKVSGKLRMAGVALLVFAGVLLVLRRHLNRWVSGLFDSFADLWDESRTAWSAALKEDGKKHTIVFCLIMMIAVAVRLVFINQPIRYDEAHSFTYYSSRPIYIALSNYSSVNNHLFHTLLVHIAYSILGNHEWALRLPALLAGLFLVPATYLAARLLYNKNAAILAAAFISVSSALIEFSTNARGYSMICLAFMLILAVGAYVRRGGGPAAWTLFTLVTALGFYTIPIMLYPFGITALWLFLSALLKDIDGPAWPFVRNLILSTVCAGVLTLALYTPVFVGSGVDAVFGIPSKAVDAAGGTEGFMGGISIRIKAFWAQWNRDFPLSVSIIMALGAILSLLFHRRVARHRVPLLVPAMLWVVPVLLVMRALPWPRVWLYLLPLYFILVSAGLSLKFGWMARLLRRSAASFCVIMALHVIIGIGLSVVYSRSVYYSEETGTLRNAEEIATTLGRGLGPGDKMLAFSPAGAPLLYYFKRHNVPLDPLVRTDRDNWQTVYVVVDVPTHDLDWVLRKTQLDTQRYSAPELVKTYDFAEIYRFEGTD
jgi:4-amino-4-deoxy-L-arabinose transferase-like glycosyltransferase